MFHVLEADTANELWKSAREWFLSDGIAARQESRNGPTLEVMNAALSLRNPRQRWIAARLPAMNPAFAIAEVVWILSGRNDSGMLNYFNPRLSRYAGDGNVYHGAYGHRIRSHFGFDQLDRAARVLAAKSDTRQVVLQIWDSCSDLPNEDGSAVSEDVPCNVGSLLKVRDGRLEWTQIMRSNDFFRGFPHNIVQFSSLQEVLAGWLGLDVGAYHHYSDSLHLYEHDGKVAEDFEDVEPPQNRDVLSVPSQESDGAVRALGKFCDQCANESNSGTVIVRNLDRLRMPAGHLNLARILAADALRRRRLPRDVRNVLKGCTNGGLKFMFERWLKRGHNNSPV